MSDSIVNNLVTIRISLHFLWNWENNSYFSFLKEVIWRRIRLSLFYNLWHEHRKLRSSECVSVGLAAVGYRSLPCISWRVTTECGIISTKEGAFTHGLNSLTIGFVLEILMFLQFRFSDSLPSFLSQHIIIWIRFSIFWKVYLKNLLQ